MCEGMVHEGKVCVCVCVCEGKVCAVTLGQMYMEKTVNPRDYFPCSQGTLPTGSLPCVAEGMP